MILGSYTLTVLPDLVALGNGTMFIKHQDFQQLQRTEVTKPFSTECQFRIKLVNLLEDTIGKWPEFVVIQ